MKRYGLFLMGCLSVFLVACGGSGGGDSPNNRPVKSSSLSSQPIYSSTSSSSIQPIALRPVTRENTPYLASAVFDLLEFASDIEINLQQLHNEISLINDGLYSGACDNSGGSYSLRVESSGSKITEVYTDCEIDGDYFSGSRITEIFDQDAEQPKRVIQRWENLKIYSVSSSEDFEQSSGYMEYIGSIGNSYDNDQLFSIFMNASIENASEGLLEVQGAEFILPYGFASHPATFSYFQNNQRYSGIINWDGVGAANFYYDNSQKKINLSGSTDAKASIVSEEYINLYWDAQGDGFADAMTQILASIDDGGLSKELKNGIKIPIRLAGNESWMHGEDLYMSRGQTLEIDITSAFGHVRAELLNFDLVVDDDFRPNGNWVQSTAGKFTLIFPNNSVDKIYDLMFAANDTDGDSSLLSVKFFIGSDYDNDKIPDAYDNDDDSDGYNDDVDDYPLNASEAKDTDGDSISDNLDADADGDGVPNFADAHPLDSSNCLETSQSSCYPFWQSDRSTPSFVDDNGVLHFEFYNSNLNTSIIRKYVHRLDTNSGKYLTPLALPDKINSNVLYLPDLGKIFTYTTKAIYQTNIDSEESSLLIESNTGFGIRYVENNHFVIGRQLNASSDSLYIESYDFNGQLISSLAGDDRLNPTIPRRYVDNCYSAITSTIEGYLWKYTNLAGENCNRYGGYVVSDKDISYDKSRVYRSGGELSDGGIYLVTDNSLLRVIPSGYLLYWLPDNSYVLYAANKVTLYNSEDASLKDFVLDQGENFVKLLSKNNTIVLVSILSETGYTNIRVFDETLTLLNTYGY